MDYLLYKRIQQANFLVYFLEMRELFCPRLKDKMKVFGIIHIDDMEYHIENSGDDSIFVYKLCSEGRIGGIRITWKVFFPDFPTKDWWAVIYIVKGEAMITWRTLYFRH